MHIEDGAHFGTSQWLLAANTLVIIILVWNGFVRGFIVLSYVPKLVDGAMPFALGAAQCFAAYFAAHDVRGWYWSIAALSFLGFIGYVNAEVNARINPEENAHVMVFYSQVLRMLPVSGLFLAAVCGGIAYSASWSHATTRRCSSPRRRAPSRSPSRWTTTSRTRASTTR